ncbi:unnamed protein product [Camellia sinensis]
MRIVARGSGSALALTGANLSEQPSSVCIKDFENLWEHCEYAYDGGVLPLQDQPWLNLSNQESTRFLEQGGAKEETVVILEKHTLLDDGMAT